MVEHNDTLESVDLRQHTLVDDHVADLLLSSLQGDTDECGQSLQTDATVVLFDHSQVMLNKLSDQVSHMLLAVTGCLLERLILCHLALNFGFIHWHQLEGQHFADKFSDQGLMFEFTSVGSFNFIQKVNFLVRIG